MSKFVILKDGQEDSCELSFNECLSELILSNDLSKALNKEYHLGLDSWLDYSDDQFESFCFQEVEELALSFGYQVKEVA